MYIRYDDSVISYSCDGIYWKDIYLPRGVNKIQKVCFKDNIITVATQDVELSYSINDDVSKQLRTYVEVEGKILGFDVEPVIESDRTRSH